MTERACVLLLPVVCRLYASRRYSHSIVRLSREGPGNHSKSIIFLSKRKLTNKIVRRILDKDDQVFDPLSHILLPESAHMSELTQADLIPAERQEYIINLIQQKRAVRVSALSEVLGVSEITIRRDLEKLEEQGILERTHGGAILTQRMRQEPLYIQKERVQIEAKRAIGKTAAGLVSEGETIFINSGSTTRQIFSHLGHIPKLRVITSNAAAIAELGSREEPIDLIVVGGTYRWQSNSFVGPIALSTIAQINASKTFLGVDGVSVQRGLTTPIQDEVEVARAMIAQTHGSIIVVADHAKIGVVAEFVTCPLKQVTTIVTDTALDDDWCESLAHDGIRIVVANPES